MARYWNLCYNEYLTIVRTYKNLTWLFCQCKRLAIKTKLKNYLRFWNFLLNWFSYFFFFFLLLCRVWFFSFSNLIRKYEGFGTLTFALFDKLFVKCTIHFRSHFSPKYSLLFSVLFRLKFSCHLFLSSCFPLISFFLVNRSTFLFFNSLKSDFNSSFYSFRGLFICCSLFIFLFCFVVFCLFVFSAIVYNSVTQWFSSLVPLSIINDIFSITHF